MPKVLELTETQRAWCDTHRCVICNGHPKEVRTELVQEHLELKPAYKHMALAPFLTPEPYMTRMVGGEYRTEVECENGHLFVAHYHLLPDAKAGGQLP